MLPWRRGDDNADEMRRATIPPFLCSFEWSWEMNFPLGRRFDFRPLSNHFGKNPREGGRKWPPSFFLLVFASQKQANTSPVRRLSTKKCDFSFLRSKNEGFQWRQWRDTHGQRCLFFLRMELSKTGDCRPGDADYSGRRWEQRRRPTAADGAGWYMPSEV